MYLGKIDTCPGLANPINPSTTFVVAVSKTIPEFDELTKVVPGAIPSPNTQSPAVNPELSSPTIKSNVVELALFTVPSICLTNPSWKNKAPPVDLARSGWSHPKVSPVNCT